MEKDRKPRDKPTHLYGQLTYDKEANEEKTVSSINDVGKTRQSHAKE